MSHSLWKPVLMIVLSLSLAVSVTACGRKGAVEEPAETSEGY